MNTKTILGAFALLASSVLGTDAQADFTASGTFRYRDRAFTYNSGFTGSEPTLPIRQANVQVRDANSGAVLAAGPTDDNGDFSIFVPGSGTRDIVVRCLARSRTYGSNRIRVQTTSGTLYNVESSTFSNWDQTSDLDVGTVIAEMIFEGTDRANPFNMLDMGVWALEYILAQGEINPTGNITIQWPGGGGSFAFGFTANMSDDDGYDDLVILHELGHVFHNMYSDSDSPGGFHTFGDSDQDPRLSYGEGWASFFAGAVRNYMGIFDPGFYMDADGGPSGFVQLRARFENASPYTNSTAGEANEVGVACVLWDIVDTAATNDGGVNDDDFFDGTVTFGGGIDGDQMQWNSFTGPVATASNLTINDHWNGFFNPVNYGNYGGLSDVFEARDIRNFLDANEPDNGVGVATPVAGDGSWLPISTLYYSGASPPAPGNGDSDFYSVVLSIGDELDVETRYPNAASNADTYADTFIRVRRPDNSIYATDDDSGTGRNAELTGLVADQAGTWTIEVTTTHPYRETGSYQLRVDRSGFTISTVTPSSIPVLSDTLTIVDITGIGFNDITSITLDGIPLAPFLFNTGHYQILSDSLLRLFKIPLVSQLGPVDLVLSRSGGGPATTQLTITEPPSPVLTTATPITNEQNGAELTMAAGPGDWVILCVSYFNSPSDYSPFTTLDIGMNDFDTTIVLSPILGPTGYFQLVTGDLTGSGLTGSTIYFQTFVQDATVGFNPPWPPSNVVSMTFF